MESWGQLAHATAQNVARSAYGKLVAFLSKRSANVAAAEDALSEAFAAALEHWPREGVPRNPEGWLFAVALRKITDSARKTRRAIEGERQLQSAAEGFAGDPPAFPDERLSLMFACAHPAIDENLRAPLILQCVMGFNAANIASAFLVTPATMGQRLSRAKSKICEHGLSFRIPDPHELPQRLAAVLEAIYAAYGKGWSERSQAVTTDLSLEAIWLSRVVVTLLPDAAEATGLLAMMLYLQARHAARRDRFENYVPLSKQDITLWDGAMLMEAESLLLKAAASGHSGRFQIEAAIQSAHSAPFFGRTADVHAIAALYGRLWALTRSPVVAINRALAVLNIEGVGPALEILPDPATFSWLSTFQPYHAARAAILAQAHANREAWQAFEIAIGLTTDPAVRLYLLGRQARCQRTEA